VAYGDVATAATAERHRVTLALLEDTSVLVDASKRYKVRLNMRCTSKHTCAGESPSRPRAIKEAASCRMAQNLRLPLIQRRQYIAEAEEGQKSLKGGLAYGTRCPYLW
jgi:hypothetical protein